MGLHARHGAAERVPPATRLDERNGPAPSALARALPFDRLDLVPQALSDQVLWHSVHGWRSTPPAPGPNASPAEAARASGAVAAFRRGRSVRAWLAVHGDGDGDDG